MTAQTFIFVHDQQIVLDYIAANKFHDLPDLKYCFLGHRDVDQIEHLPNVIVARNLPNNIEHLPNLVAWTGWYAVLRNDLITADYVNLFEYDVNVVGKWEQPEGQQAYFGCPLNEVWWNYNGIEPVLRKMILNAKPGLMPMTSNYTLAKHNVDGFLRKMLWESYGHLPQAGHIAERHCSYWLDWLSIESNRLTHLYADSHGTQGRGDRYQQIKSQLL
jgi:hypothetical protein